MNDATKYLLPLDVGYDPLQKSATLSADQLLTKALAKVDELTQQRDEALRLLDRLYCLLEEADEKVKGARFEWAALRRRVEREERNRCLRAAQTTKET